MKPTPEAREILTALMAEYAMAIDDNRLEDWVELFDEACDYKVLTRENVEQNLPNVLMWCDSKDMLRDRVESYRHVNLYNLHYDRHVLGPLQQRHRLLGGLVAVERALVVLAAGLVELGHEQVVVEPLQLLAEAGDVLVGDHGVAGQ